MLFTGVGIGADKSITTYIASRNRNTKNSSGLSWSDYADNPIGGGRTYWKSDYLYSGADQTHFPLVLEPGDKICTIITLR